MVTSKRKKMSARKVKVLGDAYKIAHASAEMTKTDFRTHHRHLQSVQRMSGVNGQYSHYEKLTSEALVRALDAIKIEADLANQLGPEYVKDYRPAKSKVNDEEDEEDEEEEGEEEDEKVRADKIESKKFQTQHMAEAHSTSGIAEAAGFRAIGLRNGFDVGGHQGFKFGRMGNRFEFVFAQHASYEKVGFGEGSKYKDIDFSRLLGNDNAGVRNGNDSVLPMPEYERYATRQESSGAQQRGNGIEHAGYGTEHAGYHTEHAGYHTEHASYDTEHAGYDTEHAGYDTEHAGYGTENAGYNTEHAGYGTEHAGYDTEHAGYGVEHAGYGTENAGYNTEHAGYGTEHAGYGTEHAGYGTENAGHNTEHAGYITHEVGYGNEMTQLVGYGSHEISHDNGVTQHVNYGTAEVDNELQFADDLTEEKLKEILAATTFEFSETLLVNPTLDESYKGALPANIIPYESGQRKLPNIGSFF